MLRTRLAQIDAEMVELQRKLDQLDLLRQPILEALGAVVYPILTLPPELTGEIFMHYITRDEDPYLVDLHHSGGGPLLLAAICREWRDLALNLPPLWSRLQISTETGSTKRLLQSWLTRAGSHPLDLAVPQDLLSTLAPHSTHWRTLSSFLKPRSFQNDDIQGRIPLLRKVALTVHAVSASITPPPIITAFSNAPQLREVYLHTLTMSSILLPWAQLTHLTFEWHETSECFEILHFTPLLEKLAVSLRNLREIEPAPVRLECLHTLEFRYWGSSAQHPLQYITLPALKHLTMEKAPSGGLPSLLAFLSRSECRLRSVSLSCLDDLSVAISVLEAVPSVSEVHMPYMCAMDGSATAAAALFNRISTDTHFLPNMQTFSLESCLTTVSYASVIRMLEARRYGRVEGRVKSFRLVRQFDGTPDEPVDRVLLRRLQALREDGLELHIDSAQEISLVRFSLTSFPHAPDRILMHFNV
ncbi:hypothetical protein DFH09DRAFT_897458 [Mycena vulgaris]|nr:hypothetical protein DFH09DRAFT_897458 [Mycena vulgaris]